MKLIESYKVLCYVDLLLGNDSKMSNYAKLLLSNGSANKHGPWQEENTAIMEEPFPMRSVQRCCKQDQLAWLCVLQDFDPRVTALAKPRSNCTVNYRLVLSSERALQNNKAADV
jgi:hypothetical protein